MNLRAAVILLATWWMRFKWWWWHSWPGQAWRRSSLSGRRLWDWLGLLLVPLTLAAVAFAFEERRDARDRELAQQRATDEAGAAHTRATAEAALAQDREQQAALESYLDRMTSLLLDHGLRTSTEESDARDVARTQTLATLRALDGTRKGMVIKFLYDSDLINGTQPVVELLDADLREVDLTGASLNDINLRGADLRGAILSRIDRPPTDLTGSLLSGVNLAGAHLSGALLSGAHLDEANLESAQLGGSVLSGVVEGNLPPAILTESDLDFANLDLADLRGAALDQTKLRGASLFWADLRGAKLNGADLRSALLTGADFREANLRDVIGLTQAQLDATRTYAGARGLMLSLNEDFRPTPTPREVSP